MRCPRRPKREAPAAARPGEPGRTGGGAGGGGGRCGRWRGKGASRWRLGRCGVAGRTGPGRAAPLRDCARGIVGTVVRPSARCWLRKGSVPARRTRFPSVPAGLGGPEAE